MSNEFDKLSKAQEGSYFAKKNEEALKRLKEKQGEEKERLSPVTGEPLVSEVLHGVVIDRCPKSGGIWLDAGELEELVQEMAELEKKGESGLIKSIFGDWSKGK